MEKHFVFQSDGEDLSAVLHLPDDAAAPFPGIIICHGFTGQKSEAHRMHVTTARQLAGRGVASLRFDFRGSGDSAGEFVEMTLSREIADAKAALDYLCGLDTTDASRVGLVGLSMGGCVGSCLAGRDGRVKALVLWSAAGDMDRIHQKYGELFGDQATLDHSGFEIGRGFLEDLPNIRPFDDLKKYTGAALVIHGANDEIVPPAEADGFAAALGGRARVHIIEGADHVFSSLPWTDEVVGLTCDFIVEVLRGGS